MVMMMTARDVLSILRLAFVHRSQRFRHIDGALIFVPTANEKKYNSEEPWFVCVVCESPTHFKAFRSDLIWNTDKEIRTISHHEFSVGKTRYIYIEADEHMDKLRGIIPDRVVLYNILISSRQLTEIINAFRDRLINITTIMT